jgi:hypothetical protein
LNSQRSHLVDLSNLDRRSVASAERAVVVAMHLTTYEVLYPSESMAWQSHLSGALDILKSLGPEICRQGLLHHILKAIRHGLVGLQNMISGQ